MWKTVRPSIWYPVWLHLKGLQQISNLEQPLIQVCALNIGVDYPTFTMSKRYLASGGPVVNEVHGIHRTEA